MLYHWFNTTSILATLLTGNSANSTQSLRIRNLEAETSRLLSENITLRERNIKLQQEVDSRPQRSTLEGIGNVKDKLEIKLAELSTLVGELGRTHGSAAQNRSPTRKRAERRSPKRSPDQRNWKNALTLSEVTGGQDGRLPPIVEDKYFPRKTLEYVDNHVWDGTNTYGSLVRKNCWECLTRTMLQTLLISALLQSPTSMKAIQSSMTISEGLPQKVYPRTYQQKLSFQTLKLGENAERVPSAGSSHGQACQKPREACMIPPYLLHPCRLSP